MTDVAWLRGLGEDGLAALLARRPEALAAPVPLSLTELVERLAMPASVVAAMRRLDRPTLQVAEAIAALGGRTDRSALDRLLGAPDGGAVSAALDTLSQCVVLTPGPGLALVPAAAGAWPSPLGLGLPVAEVLERRTADDLRVLARNLGLKPAGRRAEILAQVTAALRNPALVRAVVARAPVPVRELLDKVAVTGAEVHDHLYFASYQRAQTPVQWAIAHGMLVRAGDWESGLSMPAEVALALRGSDYVAPFDPVPPLVGRVEADPEVVARDSVAAGSAVVRLVAALLDEAGRAPLATLKSGGIGTRELRRVAKRLGCTEPEVRLLAPVAVEAGLLSVGEGRAAPTDGYDRWLRLEPAGRLAELLSAWWRLPYTPSVGDGALAAHGQADGSQALRAVLLGAVGESAITDPGALVALTVWRRPFGFGDPETVPVRASACWREAGLLGVVAGGAVSLSGRALLDGIEDLAAMLGDVGASQRTVRLQADLTAIVTGTPSAELTVLLDGAADVETRGTAYTWRFSPASVRRALDGGYTAAGLLDDLRAVAGGSLPQPLEYLIGDVARRHGAVRASTVACCLCSEDVALLAEIAADKRLRALGLRLLAPTVLACGTPLDETLAALRKAGYAPVAETADGTPVIERATAHRVTTDPRPRTAGPIASRAPAAPDPVALARALLAAPDERPADASPSLATVRSIAVNLTAGEARILAHAIDNHQPVAIDYLNRDGNPSTRIIDEVELSGNSLSAWCRLRDDHRWFNLARITAVEPVTEARG